MLWSILYSAAFRLVFQSSDLYIYYLFGVEEIRLCLGLCETRIKNRFYETDTYVD